MFIASPHQGVVHVRLSVRDRRLSAEKNDLRLEDGAAQDQVCSDFEHQVKEESIINFR